MMSLKVLSKDWEIYGSAAPSVHYGDAIQCTNKLCCFDECEGCDGEPVS